MTYELRPAPKPKARPKRKRVGLCRGPLKARNAKRKGSAFPKQRDAKYRRWVWTENPCMMGGHYIRERFSMHDRVAGDRFEHYCWGANTPAHVGDHQARGAPDFGVLVPLCRAAHQFYDEHRTAWREATGYTEKKMALAASGYGQKYVERGGKPEQGVA